MQPKESLTYVGLFKRLNNALQRWSSFLAIKFEHQLYQAEKHVQIHDPWARVGPPPANRFQPFLTHLVLSPTQSIVQKFILMGCVVSAGQLPENHNDSSIGKHGRH